jgi:hypothetical protein
MPDRTGLAQRGNRFVEWAIVALAVLIAACSARPYAGSWNDGSRLATVEALVEEHTWAIDHSIFVNADSAQQHGAPLPYAASDADLNKNGTRDKLFIAGHYYSDKSPVPALLLAGCYYLLKDATGWSARLHADHFCRVMTWASSGLAYVLAVWCIYRLSRRLLASHSLRILLTGSFALATVALPYAQHVNNHILLLAVTSGICLVVAQLQEAIKTGRIRQRYFILLGGLAGLGYTIDLGAGPMIFLCTAVFVLSCFLFWPGAGMQEQLDFAWISVRTAIVCFFAAALPWLLLHHALNALIGGTFRPANANPEYFQWPGSPFVAGNLTGRWIHESLGSLLLYAASMLAGKRGFLGHNLPLFLAVPTFAVLARHHRETQRVVFWALGCCVGTWLLYAATSNNSSGQCCSIRWFVPLLAPAYYVVALVLQRYPQYRIDFTILSGWGFLLVLLMHEGPWLSHMVPFFWPIQGLALLTWGLGIRWRRRPCCPCGVYATSV